MQLMCERIARSSNKAFATPWEVCFDVAYPPSERGVRKKATDAEGEAVVPSF